MKIENHISITEIREILQPLIENAWRKAEIYSGNTESEYRGIMIGLEDALRAIETAAAYKEITLS